jgi:hypothetical protein
MKSWRNHMDGKGCVLWIAFRCHPQWTPELLNQTISIPCGRAFERWVAVGLAGQFEPSPRTAATIPRPGSTSAVLLSAVTGSCDS